MTKTLYLFRHATATEAGRGSGDRDRPLVPAGIKEATRMGERMLELDVHPATVLCSTARRAVQTLEYAARAFPDGLPALFEDALYEADAKRMLTRVQEIEDMHPSAMIVGHNPTLHDLAVLLAGHGKPKLLAKLAEGMPKAAIFGLAFDAPRWAAVKAGDGELVLLETPRR